MPSYCRATIKLIRPPSDRAVRQAKTHRKRIGSLIKTTQSITTARHRKKMPNGAKQKFKIPRAACTGHPQTAPRAGKYASNTASTKEGTTGSQGCHIRNVEQLPSGGILVEDSAVIQVLSTEGHSSSLHHSQVDLYTIASDEEVDSPRRCINLKTHGYYQWCNIKTAGIARQKPHDHSQGLTQVKFDNCLVYVRPGDVLEQLITNSIDGPVRIINVQTNGWVETGATRLPAFIVHRWLSYLLLE